MSFSPEWLALREPADHASVNAEVRDALRAKFAAKASVRVVDLGCGAGSNLRGTCGALGAKQHWTLVDYDAKLLAAAKSRLAAFDRNRFIDVAYKQADLASGDLSEVIAGADLVTAAALFDLVSAPVINKLVAAIVANRQSFFTVLTYDGIASWLPAHAADNAMRDAFNAHQRGDKGFGPAQGPAATETLATAFARHGYTIVRGRSPWVLDRRFRQLRRELDRGFADAVQETGKLNAADIDSWLKMRLGDDDAVTIIGHEDLFAYPG